MLEVRQVTARMFSERCEVVHMMCSALAVTASTCTMHIARLVEHNIFPTLTGTQTRAKHYLRPRFCQSHRRTSTSALQYATALSSQFIASLHSVSSRAKKGRHNEPHGQCPCGDVRLVHTSKIWPNRQCCSTSATPQHPNGILSCNSNLAAAMK